MTSNPTAGTAAALSLAEKASLTTGASFWRTANLAGHGIPSIMMADGPHGLRKQDTGGDHLGIIEGAPSTCFPPAVATGSSWDVDLVERVAAAIGDEARAAGVSVVLGPGVNIKRSIRCGRNFEYFSEDPVLSGRLGAAWVRGMQSRGVGASLKHFAANNQETDRLRISADIDERPLHEIYLRAFRHIVRTEKPWTVMCAYNAINGVFAAENRWLLTELLRDEWGFDGVVVSDWGAVHDRVEALRAGLDLEMPSTDGRSAAEVVRAVEAGELDEVTLDVAVQRLARLITRSFESQDTGDLAVAAQPVDLQAHHRLAQEAAAASIVLLKNQSGLLPLSPETTKIAVIGEMAVTPRYQGSGSSLIVPTHLDDALTAIGARVPSAQLCFAPGYRLDGVEDAQLEDAATAVAQDAGVALLFLGLPPQDESEGYDREHIELPEAQTRLLDRIARTGTPVVVVLSNGSVVRLSGWVHSVDAIVEGWLLGQGGGEAIARVIFGEVNPSGRLAETIPERLEDTPDFLDFPGDSRHVRYGEGMFVGYRWYDARDLSVTFPFGHGLSYTTFEYSSAVAAADDTAVTVRVDITNSGSRAGRETVQVYGTPHAAGMRRPLRELLGFAQVDLEPGDTRPVEVRIPLDEFDHYDISTHSWRRETALWTLSIGHSSRDIRAAVPITITGEDTRARLTLDSTVGEWLADPRVGTALRDMIVRLGIDPESYRFRMAQQIPLGRAVELTNGQFDTDALTALLTAAT